MLLVYPKQPKKAIWRGFGDIEPRKQKKARLLFEKEISIFA
jgi:hypothetical protein